jgi:hypothetical protein
VFWSQKPSILANSLGNLHLIAYKSLIWMTN